MIEGMRSWLLEVITVSILCAAADSLMPAGGVKQVGKLVFGVLMVCVVLGPLAQWKIGEGENWLQEYSVQLEQNAAVLKEQAENYERAVIEERYAAYIADKAAELGVPCDVKVVCERKEDLWLPVFVRLRGELEDGVQEELSQLLQQELGIPIEGQYFEQAKEEGA